MLEELPELRIGEGEPSDGTIETAGSRGGSGVWRHFLLGANEVESAVFATRRQPAGVHEAGMAPRARRVEKAKWVIVGCRVVGVDRATPGRGWRAGTASWNCRAGLCGC